MRIHANGSRVSIGLLQFAWSHVPKHQQRNAKAFMSPLLWLDLQVHQAFHRVEMVIEGVPCVVSTWMRDDSIAIVTTDSEVLVLVEGIANHMARSSGRPCFACGWTMSITETDRKQTWCNRCEGEQ